MSTTEQSSCRRFADPWQVHRHFCGPAPAAMPLAGPEPVLCCDGHTGRWPSNLGACSAKHGKNNIHP